MTKERIPPMLEQTLELIAETFEVRGDQKIHNPLARKKPRKKRWRLITVSGYGKSSTIRVGMHRRRRWHPRKIWLIDDDHLVKKKHWFLNPGWRMKKKLEAIKKRLSRQKAI